MTEFLKFLALVAVVLGVFLLNHYLNDVITSIMCEKNEVLIKNAFNLPVCIAK